LTLPPDIDIDNPKVLVSDNEKLFKDGDNCEAHNSVNIPGFQKDNTGESKSNNKPIMQLKEVSFIPTQISKDILNEEHSLSLNELSRRICKVFVTLNHFFDFQFIQSDSCCAKTKSTNLPNLFVKHTHLDFLYSIK
jgi:hypothetical protein